MIILSSHYVSLRPNGYQPRKNTTAAFPVFCLWQIEVGRGTETMVGYAASPRADPYASLFEWAVLIFLLLLAPVHNDKGAYDGLMPCHWTLFCFWKYQPVCDCRMENCCRPPLFTVAMQATTARSVVLMVKGW